MQRSTMSINNLIKIAVTLDQLKANEKRSKIPILENRPANYSAASHVNKNLSYDERDVAQRRYGKSGDLFHGQEYLDDVSNDISEAKQLRNAGGSQHLPNPKDKKMAKFLGPLGKEQLEDANRRLDASRTPKKFQIPKNKTMLKDAIDLLIHPSKKHKIDRVIDEARALEDQARIHLNPNEDIKSFKDKYQWTTHKDGFSGSAYKREDVGSLRNLRRLEKNQSDKDALRSLVLNHELNESNYGKFKHGGEFVRANQHGHFGTQGLHDVTTVNTMKESPRAQAAMRNLRKDELNDMIEAAPGLKRVLEPMSGGEHGFRQRIGKLADETLQKNIEHNNRILSKVPEHAHNHPMVQKRLLPTDMVTIREQSEQAIRKSGRLNRNLRQHVGKVLDNLPSTKQKVERQIEILKRFSKR